MKNFLLGLSVLACAAAVPAAANAFPTCVSFSPAGYCDSMEYDSKKKAVWVSYDCAGSNGPQTKAKYGKKKATTTCDGTKGCNPAAAYGWDALDWQFDLKANTGTLTGYTGGSPVVLQQNMPIAVTAGACTGAKVHGGTSSLAH